MTVNVTHVNQPPQAVNDSYTLQNGGPQYVGPGVRRAGQRHRPGRGDRQQRRVYSENFTELTLQPFPAGMYDGANNNTMTDWSPNAADWMDSGTTTPPHTAVDPAGEPDRSGQRL